MSHPPLVEPDAGRDPELDRTADAPPDVEVGDEPLPDPPFSPAVEAPPRRLPLVGQVGRLTYALLGAGMAVLVALVGWFGFSSFGSGSPRPGAPAETAAPVGSAAVDPEQYVAAGSATPARQQVCDGLLGLCLGQNMSLAVTAFGSREADGFPRPAGSGAKCHGWRTRTLTAVRVCEMRGAIVSIRVDAPAGAGVRLAAPHQLVLDLPDPAAALGPTITARLGDRPYGSEYLRAEGESVFSFSWYLSAAPGGERGRLRIVARQLKAPATLPAPCAGGSGGYYRYQSLLPLATAPTTSVEVASAEFPDTGRPPGDC